MHHKFYIGDVLDCLKEIDSDMVQCVITSPPYWGLRDYGVDGQIGLEKTPEEFIQKMVEVFREVRRVLRKDGTLWINLGDSYSNDTKWGGQSGNKNYTSSAGGYGGQRIKRNTGLKPKDLCGIPWRVALALQADGWYLRSDIIWSKPNPMPSSIKDRPTLSHEYIFLLTKKAHYYYDNEAIKEPGTTTRPELLEFGPRPDKGYPGHINDRRRIKTNGKWSQKDPQSSGRRLIERAKTAREAGAPHDSPFGPLRNKRTVWEISTEAFPGAHFATFPTKLVEPCILAGTSPKACPNCRAPWRRVLKPSENYSKFLGKSYHDHSQDLISGMSTPKKCPRTFADYETVDWEPTCKCEGNDGSGKCIVLDPFGGSGTVTYVASSLGRDSIYIDLNPDYLDIALDRNGFKGLCHADTYEIIRFERKMVNYENHQPLAALGLVDGPEP